LVVDSQVLVDDWDDPTNEALQESIVLASGIPVPITLFYQEDSGDASIALRWQTPSMSSVEVIPVSALSHDPHIVPNGSGSGLAAAYYDNTDFSGIPVYTTIDPSINLGWGDGSPDPAVPDDDFSARWTGSIVPRYTGVYTFTGLADDGIRLVVNGQDLFDDLGDPTLQPHSGTIHLTGSQAYSITVDFIEFGGDAHIWLWWTSPNQVR
jgi:hypothetical protein